MSIRIGIFGAGKLAHAIEEEIATQAAHIAQEQINKQGVCNHRIRRDSNTFVLSWMIDKRR